MRRGLARRGSPFNRDGFLSRWQVQSEDNIANWPRRETCVSSCRASGPACRIWIPAASRNACPTIQIRFDRANRTSAKPILHAPDSPVYIPIFPRPTPLAVVSDRNIRVAMSKRHRGVFGWLVLSPRKAILPRHPGDAGLPKDGHDPALPPQR